MADSLVQGQPNISGIPTSPGTKRKRNSESASPDSRRSKRAVPAAPMAIPDNGAVSATAFMESAISAAQVAQAAQAAQAEAAHRAAQQAAQQAAHQVQFQPQAQAQVQAQAQAHAQAQAAQAQAQALHGHPGHAVHHDQHVNVDDFSALQQASVDHTEAADPTNVSNTAAAALGSMYPTLHVPQPTEETFTHQSVPEVDHTQSDSAFNTPEMQHQHQHQGSLPPNGVPMPQPPAPMQPQTPNGLPQENRYMAPKPAVGSEEWHKQRKDNHKEVERRRRETINEGINELAKIVPGCEKNKGSILQRAVAFITQLKENEQQNIEKWTLEKLLTEQAISELSTANDKLKSEVERLEREVNTWRKAAQNSGLQAAQKEEAGPTV